MHEEKLPASPAPSTSVLVGPGGPCLSDLKLVVAFDIRAQNKGEDEKT